MGQQVVGSINRRGAPQKLYSLPIQMQSTLNAAVEAAHFGPFRPPPLTARAIVSRQRAFFAEISFSAIPGSGVDHRQLASPLTTRSRIQSPPPEPARSTAPRIAPAAFERSEPDRSRRHRPHRQPTCRSASPRRQPFAIRADCAPGPGDPARRRDRWRSRLSMRSGDARPRHLRAQVTARECCRSCLRRSLLLP